MNDCISDWNDFKKSVIYKNRFFCNSNMLDKIESVLNQNKNQLKLNTKLYRARIIKSDDIGSFGKKLIPNCKLLGTEARIKAINDTKIWGYDEDGSGAPPSDKSIEGRVNPAFIPYLYLAMHPYTALAECKPYQFDYVSIATFETTKALKIADISSFKNENVQTYDQSLGSMLEYEFSHPVKSDKKDYIFTQFISEFIKHLGYTGICYKSSLHIGGKNITLFSSVYCKFIGSQVYNVKNITFNVTPYRPHDAQDIMPDELKKL